MIYRSLSRKKLHLNKFRGSKLKVIRKRFCITQLKLGSALGVTAGPISLWERNKFTPSKDQEDKLCEIFEVHADYFRED